VLQNDSHGAKIDIYSVLGKLCGPGSSVGTATDYEMDGPGIESQWG
jgi:hypothetical protein